MDWIANLLLGAGALGAALYCALLSARLKAFTALESGMGGAIAVLSAQVDDMTRALAAARGAAHASADGLAASTDRAEAVAQRLELLVAAMHDLPEAGAAPAERAEGAADSRRLKVLRRRAAPEVEAAE